MQKGTDNSAQLVDAYHAELKECMPQILQLAEKVEKVHADHPQCPSGIAAYLVTFWKNLEAHLDEEDQDLFPLLAQGKVREAPVAHVMEEHLRQSEALKEIRRLCHDFAISDNGCSSWKALYESLEELEVELLEHIQIENNLLFVGALGPC